MKTIIYKEDAIKAIPSTTIDVFENCRNCKLLSREEVIEILESLPPAQPETSPKISEILDYLDTILHPLVSPEHYDVYSTLHDMISLLGLERYGGEVE